MKKLLSFCLALVMMLTLMGMGGSPRPEDVVSIKAINIRDQQVINNNKPIMITFSAPMVPEEKVKQEIPMGQMPVVLTPQVALTGQWVSQDSFVFHAKDGYPKGRQFYMQIKDGLKSIEGNPVGFAFSFRTATTTVRYMDVDRFDFKTNTLRLVIQLSQPVSGESLAKHLTVTDVATGKNFTAEVGESGESSMHAIEVPMGERVDKIEVTISEDKGEKDPAPIGLESAYIAHLSLPTEKPKGTDPAVEVTRAASGKKSDLNLREPYCSQYDGIMRVRFPFTRSIADQPLENLIVVDPPLPYEMSGYRDSLNISQDLTPGQVVSVTLKAGLMDNEGNTLETDVTRSVTIDDYYPRVSFPDMGNFLTSAYGSKVAVDLVNIDQIVVSLQRQYDNNLPFINFDDDYYDNKAYLARDLLSKRIDITAEKNEILRRGIDIEALAEGRHGVFKLRLEYYKKHEYNNDYYMSYEGAAERWVILSDIGVTSRIFPSGATVFVNSLSTAKVLPDANVRIYSKSNQLVAQGRTNAQGVMEYKVGQEWDSQLRPYTVVVESGKDITVLPMDYTTSVSTEDTGGSRAYLEKGYEAFLYTPRGVFRPGETVDIKAFVRDARHIAPAPFPVLFEVVSSRGLEAGRGSATLSAEGGASFSFQLPTSAPTGIYYAKLSVPGTKEEIGTTHFNVEDFVPPRLEVSLKAQEARLVSDGSAEMNLSAMYLFGAPGDGLNYELGYRARAKAFSHKDWSDYSFSNSERRFDAESNLKYITGSLDKEGKTQVEFSAPDNWGEENTSPLSVQLIASVMEDGGRWVTTTGEMEYHPTDYYLGMKLPKADYFDPGKAVKIDLAAVTVDGKVQESSEKLNIEIFNVKGVWNTTVRNGRYVYNWNERLTPVKKEEVALKKGQGEFSFTPAQYGTYLVRLSDGTTTSSRRVSVWGSWDSYEGSAARGGSGRLDKLELLLDKSEYNVGDTARLTVKAPFAGTLFLGIERASQVSTRIINMDKSSIVVDLPVNEMMDPNATITAWVYRPLQAENKEWFTHRAFGVTSLSLARKPFKISVEAQAPERATPSAPLSVPFVVSDEKGNPIQGEFSVALVDEGILSLTNFQTPDPLSFFYAKRYSLANSYDVYDRLLRPELKAIALLKPGGDGAAEEAYQGSLSTEQIFLAEFIATVNTNAQGQAVAEFDIPEYSGKGRLMIVGAAKNRFASSATPVRFARDVVVEPSAPRAVAPGDSFDINLKAFTMESALTGEAEIAASVTGPLKLSGDVKNKLTLGKAGSKNLTIKASALNEGGIAEVAISVKIPGREDMNFTKTVQIAVRPPYPRTSAVISELVEAGKSKSLKIPGQWLPGTTSASFSVDRSPVMAILPALNYLREYPYGCLEQTTSRAWPWLTMTSILKVLEPENREEASITKTLASTVTRISSMQTPEGGFSTWPGGSTPHVWLSVNASHFLVEAKDRVPVAQSTLNGCIKYMRYLLIAPTNYFGDEGYAYTTKAYAAFVLTRAGDAPLSWLQTLTEHEKKMLPSGRIFLAASKALHSGNSKPLEPLLKADLTIPKEYRYGYSLETSLRNQSLQLMAWSLVDPRNSATGTLAKNVAESLGKTKWYTTQEAGIAALALGLYVEKMPALAGKTLTADLTAAGKTLGQMTGERVILSNEEVPRTDKGQPEEITVTTSGSGVAYCIYSVRGVPMAPPKAASNNLVLTRTWTNSDGKVIFNEKTNGPVVVKQGDRVTVTIRLKPEFSINDIVLSDLTPGGMEVENPRLNTSAGEAAQYAPGYLDLREDRLLVFFTQLYAPKGYEYTYTMRAVSRGTFVLPQVAAEGMYNPEINAISTPAILVVE